MENFFKFKERGTDMKTEMIAGVTTFMTMAYILAVNPNILGASGMDTGAIFTATALASAIASFCMALFANLPFVLSAGMGLNAYFAYGCPGYGIFLGSCFDSSICRRYYFYYSFSDQCA